MELYTHVKTVIESQTCPVHYEKPLMEGAGEGEKIDLTCCCTEFKLACFKLMLQILTAYKEDSEQPLKVAWKKQEPGLFQ